MWTGKRTGGRKLLTPCKVCECRTANRQNCENIDGKLYTVYRCDNCGEVKSKRKI